MSKTRDLANLADLNFDSGTMVVDKVNDRVGVGTSSPARLLHLQSSSGGGMLSVEKTSATTSAFVVAADSGAVNLFARDTNSGSGNVDFGFNTGSTRRMTIDSSGDVIVGGTTGGAANAVTLNADGYIQARYTSNPAGYFDRLSTDGNIVNFRKDGSTVGSIGTNGGYVSIGNGAAALAFQGANNRILPWNQSTNGVTDASLDLGNGSYRFKDLYLSGGVYLGGTGSANYLDDYEEGTFTPEVYDNNIGGNEITATSKYGSYTKVGNLVTVHFYCYNLNTTGATAGNYLFFRNLPFTTEAISSQGQGVGAVRYHAIHTNGGDLSAVATSGGYTYAFVWAMGNNTGDYPIRVQDVASSGASDIEFTVTYRTP